MRIVLVCASPQALGYNAMVDLAFLRTTTRFQFIALGFLVLSIVGLFSGFASVSAIFWASLLCLFAFRKPLDWSVRNRLLRTFFLLGIVPIFLIGWLVLASWQLLLGHFASERVSRGIENRTTILSGAAQDLAIAASRGASPELLDELRRRTPRMSAIVHLDGGTLLLPNSGTLQTVPAGLPSPYEGLIQSQGAFYLAAKAPGTALRTDVFVYLPLDQETLTSLTSGEVEVPEVLYGEDDIYLHLGFRDGSLGVTDEEDVRREIVARHLPGPRGDLDSMVVGILTWPVGNPNGGETDVRLPLLSRPSLLLSGILESGMAYFTIPILMIVGGSLLIVEVGALLLTAFQTRAITRTVHDLYQGTQHISKGDFAHQIPIRGSDQLSDLGKSFNGMTGQIQHFLGEMKKKEKIESELEIARQVQARLFPRTVPELKTLEMQGICIPGRFISGDYYDFVKLNDRYTAIALGDVSGKGVSAALLMASIQASFHAQLGFARSSQSPVLSTANLMALIGQQLYENTPAEKYATFFCSVYDDETGVLQYTNAGHLQPILIRDGIASTLPGDGMVVGLLPNVKYDQQEIQLLSGDVVAIFSDGIPEAENAAEKEYGEPRLTDLLVKSSAQSLDEIIKVVTASVDAWAHDPAARDDTTIVVLREM